MENIAQLGIKVDSTSIKQATNELSKLSTQSGKTEKTTNALTTGFLNLKNAVIGYASIQTARQIINTADSMNLLNARLKLATSSTAEYTSQQRALLNISKQSYTGISDTITLFTKLNPALKQVGATTEQVNSVVASFTKGLQLGGSSAQESSSAILQFSQAMGSGVLRGEEFNAIAEASPKLMSYLAKGLGVAQGELRKMAENGELTAVRVSNALLKVKTDIDKDFATLPVTVGKALTNLKTDLSLAINEIDTATGASQSLANGIITVSANIGSMAKSIIDFYRESKTFIDEHNFALKQTSGILLGLGTAYAVFTVGGAVIRGIQATTVAVYGLRTAMLALETSVPVIGWIAALAGVAAGAYVVAASEVENANLSLSGSVSELDDNLQKLYKARDEITNDKFMLDSTQTERKKAIDVQIEAILNQKNAILELSKAKSEYDNSIIPKQEDSFMEQFSTNNLKEMGLITETVKRNQKEITRLSGSDYEKFKLDLADKIEKLKKAGATEEEINKTRTDSFKEFNEKQNKSLEEQNKKLEEQNKKLEDTQKAYTQIAQIGMSQYDKSIASITEQTKEWLKVGVDSNTVLQAELDLKKQLNTQTLLENLKEELSYYEKKLQLQKDSLDKELELKGIQYANNILAIESSDKTIEQKQKLIALETELYNTTIERLKADSNTEFQDTIKSFQEDSLARQIELNNAIFDFGAGFKSSNSEIMEVSKSLAAMSDASLKSKKAETELNKKYTTEFTKYAGDVEKTKELEQQYTKDTNLLNKQAINNQILGYANLSGAISGMFKQGSKEAATFQAAQTVLALVEGTRAILTAGTGDPYTAIPRMAAMAIMVKSLLGNIGVSLGMSGSSTTTGDSFSMQKANTGTGSVLGDTSKASESISKSLSILEDYAKPEFRLSQQMAKSLNSIDSKIGGVTSLLLQGSPTALGTNYTGGFDTGFKNNISSNALSNSVVNPIGSILSKIPVIGQINSAFGNIINSALGGLFGKTSVSQTLQDSGITFANQLLGNAINDFNGSVYQTISTTVSKKSWFSSSSSTSLSTYFSELDASVNNQFSLVLRSLYDTVYQAGNALEIGSDSLNNSLNNFVVSIGKISLKDKTGTQIQELLTSIFGKIGDDLAKAAVPTITQFQKVGEGTLETLTRVASGMEQANYFIDRLGSTFEKVNFNSIINKQGDVGFEALYQSILKVEKGANFNNILSTLSGTAEDLYSAYTSLDLIRDRLTFLGKGLDGLSISVITGAGGLEQLSDGISSFIENFYSSAEQQQLKVSELNQELNRTGITTIPTTIQGFKDLVNGIDTTTESGQKLYGSLISLSDSFYNVYSDVEKEKQALLESQISNRSSLIDSLSGFVKSISSSLITTTTFKDFSISFNSMIDAIKLGTGDLSTIGNATIETAQSYLDTVSRTAKSSAEIEFAKKIVANKFEGVINAKDITLGTINDTLKISFNEDSVIVKALNDVKNELVYLNQLNTRQTANSNKTLQLQRASIA